ncbi:MAG TPA: lytic transglycosylase domain-containing protein [Longimicrobiaceae bacterium]|nr:lytic transglycosylase domain-containing protein [Longimicrobiaceae bacterium]
MRRWPSAADEGAHAPVRERLNARYRRAYDGGNPSADRRRRQSSWAMQRLRSSPVRNGLIGLAIAGVGAPLGVNRYQEALRTDSAHERIVAQAQVQQEMDDAALTEAWAEMNAEQRSAVIEAKLEENREYRLTREMAEDIYEAAVEAEVDPDVAFGLVRAESSFRNTATSPVGAVGLTQLMPRTAAWMQPGVTADELRDQKTNLRVGFKYLRYLVNKYDGDTRLALLAYNRGPGTVDKALKQGENPDNGYADFVAGKADHGHRLFTNAE